MKYLLFLLFAGLISTQSLAQDPDLFQTWYLYEITHENGDGTNIANWDPPIAPWLVISETLEYNGFGICNTFEGTYLDFTDHCFNEITTSFTTEKCGFFEDQLEDEYFNFFGGESGCLHISTDGDGFQTLTMGNIIFSGMVFRNTPILSNPEFNKITVTLHPNPTSDVIFITSEQAVVKTIAVFDLSGKRIPLELSANQSVDVSVLHAGMYFMEITSENDRTIQKIIKN